MGDSEKRELIALLRAAGIVQRGPVKLKHGGISEFHFDVERSYGDPVVLKRLCSYLGRHISNEVTCIAGAGYGGLPLASLLSATRGLKLTLVRERAKSYGRATLIDGYVPKSTDVVSIIDDVLTTGKSVAEMLGILEPTGTKISTCAVVVARRGARLDVPLVSLLTEEDLVAA